MPRLLVLHGFSRRVPAALLAFVLCGVALRLAEQFGLIPASGLPSRLIPLVIETGVAVILSATLRSPFGEPERGTGRRLVYLRGATTVLMTAVATGALLAGATGTALPGGNLSLLRDTAGLIGIGLLAAAVLGGSMSWVGPLAYLVIAQLAIDSAWRTPWLWPARPGHDRGAALCAALVLAVAIVVATVTGARDPKSD